MGTDKLEELERKYNPPKMPSGTMLGVRLASEYRKTPPEVQLKLFPDIEDEIIRDFEKWKKRYKQKNSRIRNIAKKYDIDEKQAKKYYESAQTHIQEEIRYKNYLHFKDYFEWLHTDKHLAYVKEFMAEIRARQERWQQQWEQKLKEGIDHAIDIPDLIVALKVIGRECNVRSSYSGPLSYFTKTHGGINKEEFLQMLEAGVIEISLGTGNFDKQIFLKPEKRNKVPICKCGRFIEVETQGMNKKLGAKEEKDFKCEVCLGLTREYVADVARHYRSNGCNMFG